MASKSKRAVALVLTAMMAAGAFAGCGPTETGSSGGGTTTTPSNGGGSVASTTDVSTVDMYSEEMIQTVKDAIATEAETAGGTINLTMWCSGDDRDFEKSLAKEFTELYADSRYTIKVKQQTVGEDQSGGKINESPKDGADVFSFADDQLSTMVETKALAPVGQVFYNNVIANNSADSVAVVLSGDKPYAFPKTSDNGYFMYYDKRVYTDPSMVENMDEMIATANKAGKSVYLNLTNGWYNTSFFFSAGCEISYKDGKQIAHYATPEGLVAAKAMCHLASMVDSGFMAQPGSAGDNAAVVQGFQEGKLAAAVIGTWCGPDLKNIVGADNLGAAKLPTVLMNDQQVQLDSFGGYKLVGVNAFTKFPITAQALAYYLTNPDSQLKRYNTRGLIPTANAALATDVVKNDPALQAIQAQLPFAHPQGSSVGGVYWASNIGGFGSTIVTEKGKIDDSELEKQLAELEGQMK